MKSLNRAIDRFCYKHPKFGIKNLMLFIIIGNILVYFISLMDNSGYLFNYYLALYPSAVLQGEVWRLVTFIFVPDSANIIYLALFLYFYYFIGNVLEREWGSGRFTIYYFMGVLLTIAGSFIMYLFTSEIIVYGAVYINLSLFFAYATLFPDNRVLLFFIIPIKIKWLAILDAGYFLLTIILELLGGSPGFILPIIAMLNYLLFCGGTIFAAVRSLFGRVRYKSSPNVINFNQARNAAKRESNGGQGVYERKCAVCGRTQAEHPELEFRYCSRCAGYHCFCQDHINSHVHFTE